MAVQAHGVASHRLEGIQPEHGHLAFRSHVGRSVPMARLAGDAAESERGVGVMVACVRQRRGHPGRMAVQASGIDRQGQGHLAVGEMIGRHVPQSLFGIPVDRRFEPVALLLKQVGAPPFSGSDEVQEFLLAAQTIERHEIGRLRASRPKAGKALPARSSSRLCRFPRRPDSGSLKPRAESPPGSLHRSRGRWHWPSGSSCICHK